MTAKKTALEAAQEFADSTIIGWTGEWSKLTEGPMKAYAIKAFLAGSSFGCEVGYAAGKEDTANDLLEALLHESPIRDEKGNGILPEAVKELFKRVLEG